MKHGEKDVENREMSGCFLISSYSVSELAEVVGMNKSKTAVYNKVHDSLPI